MNIAKSLQNRTERVKKHPAKEYCWNELQKREGTLEMHGAFLQKLAARSLSRLEGNYAAEKAPIW